MKHYVRLAMSKFWILTRVDSGDPVPNVLALVKATFWLPISEVQLTTTTHVSERFVPMVGTSRQHNGS